MVETSASRKPVSVAIAGCGAVARLYYAQALAALSNASKIKLTAAFDPNRPSAEALCSQFKESKVADTFEDCLNGPEVLIVASPPRFHAEQVKAALNAGLHVFCEKPLATNSDDAVDMLLAAKQSKRMLGVGLIRRHLPAARMIRELLKAEVLGRPRRVHCFEGGPMSWPVHSPAYFSRSLSGGGVLQDIGTHALDLLTWWFGPPLAVDYEDDAMGGVEANCRVVLDYPEFQAVVRLSRDWQQPNRWFIEGEKSWLAWNANDGNELELGTRGGSVTLSAALKCTESNPQRMNATHPVHDFHASFEDQIASFINAVRGGTRAPISGELGLDVLRIIDRCYATRRLMHMPWLSEAELARALALSDNPT
ncbi:Gfo/Idh/MocA family oxidoreductase [Microvirga terrae]|uniref:Gfo/Idh/MocA family oxidoreductase n=1 Tax=Microvirga terrae TaxID=2740529 RepID=A0ABY5RML1_9HYPH|nr:Gfo/Idh/MocA family oxidoreductase [Microvirga terrae]UVF18435.1 Gfo/Idh/MocA family oxidoreductase [Microvirga terrae]